MSELFTLDFAIVAAYLLITLVVGIVYGRGITTMRQYVIGDRHRYGLFVLVATLFATIVGGGTVGDAERAFSVGTIWSFALLGLALRWFFIARYIAPHVTRLRGKLSVGEIMGDFYGKTGSVVTGIAGIFKCMGVLGAQISAIGYIFHYFLGITYFWGTLSASIIIVVYSSFGGIRSVTATDIVQFGALVIIIPLVAFKMLWQTGGRAIYDTVPVGHFNIAFREDLWRHIFIFIFMAFPILDPANIQRLLMCRDAEQAHDSFKIASFLHAAHIFLVTIIGLSVFTVNSNLNPQLSLPFAVDNSLFIGLRGIGIVGLFALIMSSADSYLHAASVLLVHDVVQPLRRQTLPDDKELKLTRVMTFLLGMGSVAAALSFKSVIDIILISAILWAPIVPAPLFAGIIGYRSSVRSFVVSGAFGILTMFIWKIFGIAKILAVDLAVPGLLANLIAFVIARRFDKPEELHFGEDEKEDPRWQKYVEKLRLRRQRGSGIMLGLARAHALRQRLGGLRFLLLWARRGCRRVGQIVVAGTRAFVQEWLPTPRKVCAFCEWVSLLWMTAYAYTTVALLTLLSLIAYSWLGFGGAWNGVVLSVRVVGTGLSLLVLLRQHVQWRWLHANLPVIFWGTYVLHWPFAATLGLLTGDKPMGELLLLLAGLVIPLLTMDVRAALRAWSTGVACACAAVAATGTATAAFSPQLVALLQGTATLKLFGYAEGMAGLTALLTDLLAQGVGGGVLIALIVALLAGCRERQAQLHVQTLLAERAKVAHDINNHLAKGYGGVAHVAENMEELVQAHKKLARTDPLFRAKTDQEYGELAVEPRELINVLDCAREYLEELMSRVKNPLEHVPKMEVFYLNRCIDDAIDKACENSEQQQRITWNPDEFQIAVWGNKTGVTYAMVNLLRNSLAHTNPTDQIKLVPRHEGGMVQTMIKDTGPGILNRDLPLLFKAGYSRRKGGHGFGLSGSRDGVALGSGWVYADSLHGYGACFVVELLEATQERLVADKAEKKRARREKRQKNQDLINELQRRYQNNEKEIERLRERLADLEPQLRESEPNLQRLTAEQELLADQLKVLENP